MAALASFVQRSFQVLGDQARRIISYIAISLPRSTFLSSLSPHLIQQVYRGLVRQQQLRRLEVSVDGAEMQRALILLYAKGAEEKDSS